ncbi:MAG: hypothetical protein WBN93_12120, partial [Acidimicrobiia bacterium]
FVAAGSSPSQHAAGTAERANRAARIGSNGAPPTSRGGEHQPHRHSQPDVGGVVVAGIGLDLFSAFRPAREGSWWGRRYGAGEPPLGKD